MTWNYRIVRYRDEGGYGLHEVYYDDDGQPWAMTEKPCGFACHVEEGPVGVQESLATALEDATQRPVLDEPEQWPGKPPPVNEFC